MASEDQHDTDKDLAVWWEEQGKVVVWPHAQRLKKLHLL